MVHTNQPAALFITIFFPCLSTISVVLRLYSRYFLTRAMGLDDFCIFLAMVLSIGLTCTTAEGIKYNYVGYHNWDIPKNYDFLTGAKFNFATQLLYNPILALVKNAVLLFLLRLGGRVLKFRYWIYFVMFINTTMMIGIFFTDMFQCRPFAKAWDATRPGYCISMGDFFIATGALTILTDLFVVILPTWITARLQMPVRKKIAIIILLSLGLIVTAVGIYRMVFLIKIYYPTGPPDSDSNYSLSGTASSIEVSLAIIAACGPPIKPLVNNVFPRIFGNERSTPRGNGPSGAYPLAYGNTRASRAGNHSVIQGGHDHTYELRGVKGRPLPNTVDDDDSEKEIMTYDGIMRKTDINVTYANINDGEHGSRRRSEDDGSGSGHDPSAGAIGNALPHRGYDTDFDSGYVRHAGREARAEQVL